MVPSAEAIQQVLSRPSKFKNNGIIYKAIVLHPEYRIPTQKVLGYEYYIIPGLTLATLFTSLSTVNVAPHVISGGFLVAGIAAFATVEQKRIFRSRVRRDSILNYQVNERPLVRP